MSRTFALGLLGLAFVGSINADTPRPARQNELLYLLHQDCGACHGSLLKGGLGPSLLPERLKSMPEAALIQTILNGRPGTPMPPWRTFINEAEAAWLVKRLKTGATQ